MRNVLHHRFFFPALILVAVIAVPVAGSRLSGAPSVALSVAPQSDKAPVDAKITTPKQQWGHNIGDDYFLADYRQLVPYWKKLATQSPRVHIEDIGPTSMGKTMVLATVTAPENWSKIARYKQISRSLSLNEGPDGRPLTDEQARALAKEGKAVVWIDGGLHASEYLGAQQLMEMVYQMVARTDEETMRFLNDVIILFCPVNPDGQDLVVDGYMKHGGGTPIQYNFYAGHDDNRDSYMNALKETTNISRIMYREWFPQIMYNHHQAGPQGSVMYAPPFRDPFNYNFHPGIAAATDLIGAIIQTRFIEEGKPGVVSTKGSTYSTWWNGGLRTTAYFHNQIGILTETIGSPTPSVIPFNRQFAIAERSWFWRIEPQPWHFRQSIEYSITANRAVLDFASRYREVNNYRIYSMGRDEIKWGSEDHWTFTPHKTEKICTEFTAAQAGRGAAAPAGAAGGAAGAAGAGAAGTGAGAQAAGGGRGGGGGGGRGGGGVCNGAGFYDALRAAKYRDPRAWIMPSDAPDFGAAVRFVNALFKSGITIQQATAPITVGSKTYPANSLVVTAAQAFRPHVMDMFEPQDHPDDIPYPGAPPTRPYDNAGYTLAFQMGVQFDRILDGLPAGLPLKKLTDYAKPPAGTIKAPAPLPFELASPNGPDPFSGQNFPDATVSDRASARELYKLLTGRVSSINGDAAPQAVAGYYFSHKSTDNFIAVNRLLAAGEDVSWLFDGPLGNGTFYVASKATTRAAIQKVATEVGTNFQSTTTAPTSPLSHLKPLRIGIVDSYGGGVPAGWTRLALENFEFKFEQVFPPMLDAGNLRAKYDVLLCIDACFGGGGGGRGGGGGAGGDAPIPGGDAGAVTAGGGAAGGGGGTAGAGAGAAGGGGAAAAGAGRGGAGGGGGRGQGAGGGAAAVKDPNDDRPAPTPWEEEYTRRRGSITAATLAKIQEFIEQGGTIVAVGSGASGAISQFKIPLANHLVKPDGTGLGNDYYVPGSVLQIAVDPKNPLAHGYGETADVFFDNSPVWKISGAAGAAPLRVVGWFNSPEPLRSGWAWGQRFLDKGIEIVETNVGQGRLFLFGNDLMFRSQPLGSYKFLFNAMYLSVAPDMKAGAGK